MDKKYNKIKNKNYLREGPSGDLLLGPLLGLGLELIFVLVVVLDLLVDLLTYSHYTLFDFPML